MKKHFLGFGLALGLVVSSLSVAVAQTKPAVKSLQTPPTTVLYVGNSFFYYNNSMHGHVARIASEGLKGTDQKYRGVSVTISGSGLDWHDMDSLLRPNGIGRYSFAPGNKVVFNPPSDKPFDAVIMMDCSQCPIHETLSKVFTEYSKKHSDSVRKRGGHPVLFMSWAYQDVPSMTKELAEAYTKAGNDNRALVIPAGLAFANSIAKRPDINLYVPDLRHPSLAGTYLSALTTYGALFGRPTVGLSYDAGLPKDVAAHLQIVADETVKSYYGR